MRIESEKIKLLGYDATKIKGLRADQVEMLKHMQSSASVVDIVQAFYSQGRLISFLSLLDLLQVLLSIKAIANPAFYNYFLPQEDQRQTSEAQVVTTVTGTQFDKNRLAHVPFLRSLNADLLNIFLQNSSVMQVPEGVVFCQEGADQRSLLVLLRGQASVYKRQPDGKQKKLVVLNENSLFGEAAFFFGTPRSATVVADSACEILIIRYVPALYDGAIKTEKAQQLQWRIWAVHALLKSDIFSDLPQECFDALIFAGEMKSFSKGTVFCRQGDVGEVCYIIVQGRVQVIKDQKSVAHLEQGDCFGELALMVTGGKRTATVQAESDGIVLEIHRSHFYRLLAQNLLLACGFERVARKRNPQR